MFRKISFEETEKGYPFTREQLAQWGVDYPPRKGRLSHGGIAPPEQVPR